MKTYIITIPAFRSVIQAENEEEALVVNDNHFFPLATIIICQ